MALPTPGRLGLVDARSTHPAVRAAFDSVRALGAEPGHLHRVLAHAPSLLLPVLQGTRALAVAPATTAADRALVILRTAQLCDSGYVAAHHAAAAVEAGVSPDQIRELPGWLESGRFPERQRAILAYVDGMFGPDGVRDGVFAALARLLSAEEVVELTWTAAFYSGIARFAAALEVPLEPGSSAGEGVRG